MGLSSTRGYRKCAKIVGEVMGNYPPARRRLDLRHARPHGAGLQHALRRSSTARATSARSTATRRRRCGTPRRGSKALGDEMMTDLDKETVDFVPNYDETTEEPTVLPAPFPNLLVNGSAGIAVGMATNIPPHNMREVIDAVIWTIESAQADDAADARREAAQAARARARARLPHRRLHRRPPRASSRRT